MAFLEGVLAILTCQLVGTVLADAAHLPVPGPVVGMVLLLALLAWRRPAATSPVLRAGDGLLRVLPLLFVPAGVGVVTCLGLVREHWLTVSVGFVLPWIAGLVVAAAVAGLAARSSRASAVGEDE